MKAARIYLRVSTREQSLTRQTAIIDEAQAAGFYVAGIYREHASGARSDRPELLRMVADLQPGDVVIAEKIDRISRLPLDEAEMLVARIRAAGATLAIPGIIDFSEVTKDADGITRIVLDAMQDLLLKLALQMAREEYEDRRERQAQGVALAKKAERYKGRTPNVIQHQQILAFRGLGKSITETAALVNCSIAQVKIISKRCPEMLASLRDARERKQSV